MSNYQNDSVRSQNFATSAKACGDAIGKMVGKPVTIGEHLDRRIEVARKNVEDLCITKAKLEALNVLDHPLGLYENVMF
jgi:hypothetical protein